MIRPANADNVLRFQVEVDDAKRMQVSHTLANLKKIIVVIIVDDKKNAGEPHPRKPEKDHCCDKW